MIEMRGPLTGLRVLDLTQHLAGPFCTMLLADLGADVVKVEPPAGDVTRSSGPFRADDQQRAFGGYFQSVNRNKRSIVLDLKADADRLIVRKLAVVADVVVENFRAGTLERLGLSYEDLAKENRRLVYLAIRGFGDPRTGESPYVSWPAFDIVAQAMGGFMSITGLPGGVPIKSGPGLGDIFPGALGAVGVLAAVIRARETGLGQFVDVAMYDAILVLCERIVHQYSYQGEVPHAQGNSHPLLCPFDVFPTADGYVAIAAPIDAHWRVLCEVMGRLDLLADGRYQSNDSRVANAGEVRAAVSGWTERRTMTEVVDLLAGKVPVGPVNTVADIFTDPHIRARKMVVDLEQPGSKSNVQVVGTPIKLTETPGGVRTRAPLLDEHRHEILSEWCGEG